MTATELLVRYLLDEDFRATVDANREAVLALLPEPDREAFRAGDGRLLRLLSEALSPRTDAPPEPAPMGDEPAPTGPRVLHLPPVRLCVTIEPQTAVDASGVEVRYRASVHGGPVDAPAGVAAGDAPVLPGVAVSLRLDPVAVEVDGRWSVRWPVDAAVLGERVGWDAQPPGATPSEETPRVREALDAVRAAQPDERYGALLDLLAALHP